MRELLERWAAIEPDVCENLYGQTIRLHLADDHTHSIHPVVDSLKVTDLAMVQAAVQEAIVSRGWWWKLVCYRLTGTCEGVIFSPTGHQRGLAATPTEALLSAYLKALEVSK